VLEDLSNWLIGRENQWDSVRRGQDFWIEKLEDDFTRNFCRDFRDFAPEFAHNFAHHAAHHSAHHSANDLSPGFFLCEVCQSAYRTTSIKPALEGTRI